MTKLQQLKNTFNAGDINAAICMAAKFQNLGTQAKAIRTAAECIKRPAFYLQMKHDIAANIKAGELALIEKYNLN